MRRPQPQPAADNAGTSGGVDLLLSAGLLAFARHAGFLAAVEEAIGRRRVGAVVGTSSGALVGSLWAAGHSAAWITDCVAGIRPLDLMKFSPWRLDRRGIFSLAPLMAFLRQHLPPRIEDLSLPFAAGVCNRGEFRLLRHGPLAEAVAASCAIPLLFQQVVIDGTAYVDGGVADRVGYQAWCAWRPGDVDAGTGLLHWVESSRRGNDAPMDHHRCTTVSTPASGASFFNLGDVGAQAAVAKRLSDEACLAAGAALPAEPTRN